MIATNTNNTKFQQNRLHRDEVDSPLEIKQKENISVFKAPVVQAPVVEAAAAVIPSKSAIVVEKANEPVPVTKKTHFYYIPTGLNQSTRYRMTLSHFENLHNFYAQIVDWFLVFDELYDEFQEECEASQYYLTKESLG